MTSLAQLHDCHSCNDERSIDQKKQLQSGNSRFLGAGPVGRRQGTTAIWELKIFWWQVLLQSRFFGWQAQLENDRATTVI